MHELQLTLLLICPSILLSYVLEYYERRDFINLSSFHAENRFKYLREFCITFWFNYRSATVETPHRSYTRAALYRRRRCMPVRQNGRKISCKRLHRE